MKTILRVEQFEDRLVPAVAIDSAHEAYSWVLVNTLRQNPIAFANNLQGLVNGTVQSAFGFSKSDPVVADLTGMINRASFPANYSASLNLMRSTPAAGPLGWDETLENRAGTHDEWMKVNGFAHTETTGNRTALPGYSKNDSAPADSWGYAGQYSAWGENIGYGYGMLRATREAYNTGAIGLAGLQQRAAFIDTVGYMLELNSGSLGHLRALLGRDSGAGGMPTYNAFGADVDLYEAPAGYEIQDGVPEAYVSTHRLAMYRPGGSGGFIAGVAYSDSNRNGYYNAGEGSAVTINVRDAAGNGFTDTLTAAHHGAFSGYVANGTYTVTIASGGTVLDSRTVTVNNSNAWAEFQAGGVGRPTVTSPVGSQSALRPTVSWTTANGATAYQVRVDDLTARTNLVNNAAAGGNAWAPTTDLVSGRLYRVWVRAIANGVAGAWSDPRDFTLAAPNKIGPLGTTSDLRPTLSWTSINGASAYEVRINDVSARLSNIFPSSATTGTSWQPPIGLTSGRTYTWQVRALNQNGLGAWSTAGTFVVATPKPTGPATGVANLRPTFTWTAVNNASAYEIAVNDLSAAVTNLFKTRVSGTSWAPPIDLVSGRVYTWQVRALNSFGQGMLSKVAGFAVGRPGLTGPVGDVSSARPTFTWTGIGWAPSYQVRVYDVTFGQTLLYQAKVSSLHWNPPADLMVGHTYRWSVRALNSSGFGMWSPSQTFRIV